ncbi:MAG: hypothetical protein Q7K45_06925 [Nanoarchaeota archaeon]|nr:hypothetical protein [Nanoarchaeota archaeon]
MINKPMKKEGPPSFVESMLHSAQDTRDVKPQNRYDNVNPADIEKVMANLKKGVVRR